MLQKLQNKAARIKVTNSPFDASAAPLLQRLGWPSVQKLINKETGSMVYKSLDSLAPRYLSDLFVRLSGVHPRELRNSKTDLAIPMLRTGNGKKSFAYRGASLWNILDFDTKMAPFNQCLQVQTQGKIILFYIYIFDLAIFQSFYCKFYCI